MYIFVVNGVKWRLKFVRPDSSALMRENGTYSIGSTDKSTKTISIADNLDYKLEKHVVYHEICHAYIMTKGISMAPYDEEKLCNIVADIIIILGG